jgi:DNA repair protein RecN (Recombination protein N)
VAKFAQTHFLVDKMSEDSVTRTRIRQLDEDARCQELARMLGGGQAALEHAKSLLCEK